MKLTTIMHDLRVLYAGVARRNFNSRIDRFAGIRESAKEIPALERFVGKKCSDKHTSVVMIVGSSWPEDEAIYVDWICKRRDVKLILAPYQFNASRLAGLKELLGEGTVLMSEAETNPSLLDNAKVVILDCDGLLYSAYAYADIAYVGGGFGAGVHNIIEPAAFGIPVIYGPRHENISEAIELKTLGGGIAIAGKLRFEEVADRLFFDKKEREMRGRWAIEYISEKIVIPR